MRIVHLIKHCHNGHGSVHVAVDLACLQAQQGFDVVYASSGGSFDALLDDSGVRRVRIVQEQRLSTALVTSLVSLVRLCHAFKPDIIHAHMMSSAVFGYAASTLTGVPLLTTVHNSFDRHSLLMKLGRRIVAVSHAERTLLIERGFRDRKIDVVLNGPAHSPRERFGACSTMVLKRPNIMTVCGLHQRKGVHDLIRAFEIARAQAEDWHLYVVGDGPDRPQLEALARARGVEGSVHFLGSVDRPKPLLEQADIFALASHAEPFGLVLAEARSAGCAIVATDVGGIPEVLDDGRAGRLVPAGRPEMFAAALLGLMRDGSVLNEWRVRSRSGCEMFDAERMVADYARIYERMSAQRHLGPPDAGRAGARSGHAGAVAGSGGGHGRRHTRIRAVLMEIEKLALAGVVLLRPRRFGDARGYFAETFSQRMFRERVAPFDFVQDNEAMSAATGTLRGLHFQRDPMAQGKLVRAIAGAILDVAVDIRHGSPTFGRHVAVRLDATGGAQLWVPPGFAHGYCTLEPHSAVAYKVTNYYSPADDGGILWSDPALAIPWPVGPGDAVLSEKDTRLPRLADLPPIFAYDGAEGGS